MTSLLSSLAQKLTRADLLKMAQSDAEEGTLVIEGKEHKWKRWRPREKNELRQANNQLHQAENSSSRK